MARRELHDHEWELIEPLLPIGRFGPYAYRLREQFEGVIWRFRTGSQWREIPREFGAWPTVHDRFPQWRSAGVFAAPMEAPLTHDVEQYKGRNTVERAVNKIKAWRGLATRYDKTPDSYLAGLQLRSSIIWLRSLHPA